MARHERLNEASVTKGFRPFWSHGGNRRAGVGILVSLDLLKKFSLSPLCWVQINEGEAAILRLQGDEGNLDICCTYFPTGNQGNDDSSLFQLRSDLRTNIAANIGNPEEALSLVAGDFNYVTDREDRWSNAS